MKLSKRQRAHSATIIDKLYADGPCSRVDLAKVLNITPATMSDLTQRLMDQNILHEVGEDPLNYRAGRRKILLDIYPNHSYYIGVEVFDAYISMCLTNNVGTVIQKKIRYHKQEEFYENFKIEALIGDITKFIEEDCKDYQPSAIGLALPGQYNKATGTLHTHHPFWGTVSFSLLPQAFDIPVLINDIVKCLSYSQRLFAQNRSDENFIFVHVRKKIIGYCMYQGSIYGDDNTSLGEIGHTVINPHGEVCECGKRGCLQTYISEQSMIRKAQMIFDISAHNFFHDLVKDKSDIDMSIIIKAYKLGDKTATRIINNALYYLAIAIQNYAMMMDVSRIFIHGLIFNELDFVETLKKSLNGNTANYHSPHEIETVIKTYDPINGAVGACAYCITEELKTSYAV